MCGGGFGNGRALPRRVPCKPIDDPAHKLCCSHPLGDRIFLIFCEIPLLQCLKQVGGSAGRGACVLWSHVARPAPHVFLSSVPCADPTDIQSKICIHVCEHTRHCAPRFCERRRGDFRRPDVPVRGDLRAAFLEHTMNLARFIRLCVLLGTITPCFKALLLIGDHRAILHSSYGARF